MMVSLKIETQPKECEPIQIRQIFKGKAQRTISIYMNHKLYVGQTVRSGFCSYKTSSNIFFVRLYVPASFTKVFN